MAKKVKLKAKQQIVGRSMEGEDLAVDAGKTFETDDRTAKDLLNAGYAEMVESPKRRSTATAEE
jgi:hypothetical protein